MKYLFAIINPNGTTKSVKRYDSLKPIYKLTKLSVKEVNDIIYGKTIHNKYRIHRRDEKGWI